MAGGAIYNLKLESDLYAVAIDCMLDAFVLSLFSSPALDCKFISVLVC
jgi:hypothetical protein